MVVQATQGNAYCGLNKVNLEWVGATNSEGVCSKAMIHLVG